MATEIRLPAAWNRKDTFDFLQIKAGQHYILDQLDSSSTAIQPEHVFRSDNPRSDTATFSVFSDGSLYFCNNAEDEVWVDYQDFVTNTLLPGLEAQPKGICWTQDDCDEADDINAWVIDGMDKGLLLHYCGGDEAKAREMAGCSQVESTNEG